jgi:hypothetical protein
LRHPRICAASPPRNLRPCDLSRSLHVTR